MCNCWGMHCGCRCTRPPVTWPASWHHDTALCLTLSCAIKPSPSTAHHGAGTRPHQQPTLRGGRGEAHSSRGATAGAPRLPLSGTKPPPHWLRAGDLLRLRAGLPDRAGLLELQRRRGVASRVRQTQLAIWRVTNLQQTCNKPATNLHTCTAVQGCRLTASPSLAGKQTARPGCRRQGSSSAHRLLLRLLLRLRGGGRFAGLRRMTLCDGSGVAAPAAIQHVDRHTQGVQAAATAAPPTPAGAAAGGRAGAGLGASGGAGPVAVQGQRHGWAMRNLAAAVREMQ